MRIVQVQACYVADLTFAPRERTTTSGRSRVDSAACYATRMQPPVGSTTSLGPWKPGHRQERTLARSCP